LPGAEDEHEAGVDGEDVRVREDPAGRHVWPFDNAIIAWGMRRYGFRQEAATLAEGMFEAAGFFGGRLPQAFAGYDPALTKYPVEYPTACSPQAWSAGARRCC
jgi:glycogen debranching enzyme